SPVTEASAVEQHLNACVECRQKYHDLSRVSKSLENFVGSISPKFAEAERETLALLLKTEISTAKRPQRAFQRLGWGMALAASLAIGLILTPQFKHTKTKISRTQEAQQSAASLEVDGETFVPLPYSNPDLPIASHHIVQMQVPVSSLADAGVHFEAISNEVSSGNDSVLADVLLGIDGQPLGVHVLSVE